MNYIKHLTGFFDKIVSDTSLNPTHISLYIGLFQFWNINRFINPISVTRDEVMRISKIYSKATYHKCIKELHKKGYIIYQPSYNPFKGSLISICDLTSELKQHQKRTNASSKKTPNEDQNLNNSLEKHETGYQTSSEQVVEQALVPSINYTNNKNISNKNNFENILNLSEKNNFDNEQNLIFEKNEKEMLFAFADTEKNQTESGRQKSSAKKEKDEIDPFITSSEVLKPTLEQVKDFFIENNFPEVEAQKFFNYFSSNGWLVGGRSPMVNWYAAADNWMLNFNKFNPTEQQALKNNYLSTTTLKNYSEPL